MLGINLYFHFQMPSVDYWHKIGHALAPKEPWKGVLDHPGMRSVWMESPRSDGYTGKINVWVEPSVQIQTGLFVSVNDHYEVPQPDSKADPKQPQGATQIIDILEKVWNESLARSRKMAYSLAKIGE
jgi:hypothetical protein